jgi:hypothetical protein
MTDISEKTAQLRVAANVIRDVQIAYDSVAWADWEAGNPPFAKLRHIHLHLARTLGKLATVCHPLDHVLNDGGEVDLTPDADVPHIVADLIHHAAQIASLYNLDLGTCVIDRYRENALRFCPDSDFAKL